MLAARRWLRTVHGFKIPDIGEGISEVQLMDWFVKQDDVVKEMDKLCLVESDKAAVEITSKYSGKVVKLHFSKFDKVKIGSVLVDIDDGLSGTQSHEPSQTKAAETTTATLATPAVRQLAKQLNVNLANVQGSGSQGRVTKEDVEQAARPAVPDAAEAVQRTELRGVRAAMAKSMTASAKIPHLTIGEEVRMDRMLDILQTVKDLAKTKYNLPSLTLTSFLIKALSLALQRHPELNSKCVQKDGVFYLDTYQDHNVSVAIQTEHGLMVPNIKQVNRLSIPEIQRELLNLVDKAKNNRLLPDDIKGGTISLSNIGVIGGTYAQPVLFDGQAVIGVVGRVRTLPRFSGSTLEPHRIANFSWSADHRIVDGASMAVFSRSFKDLVENPDQWLLDLK